MCLRSFLPLESTVLKLINCVKQPVCTTRRIVILQKIINSSKQKRIIKKSSAASFMTIFNIFLSVFSRGGERRRERRSACLLLTQKLPEIKCRNCTFLFVKQQL